MHRAVAKKKILAQEMGQKKFWQAKNPPPPPLHHFSNGPSLMWKGTARRETGRKEAGCVYGRQE